jgi:tetratricopeptide (TPR) repeat protein
MRLINPAHATRPGGLNEEMDARALSLTSALLCGQTPAQNSAECDAATASPPEQGAPDYRNSSATACDALGRARPIATGVVSARRLAHKSSKSARQEFNRGFQAQQKGQYNEAIRHFTEAVRLDPIYVEAEADLGMVYSMTGEPEAAIVVFDRALAIEPNWPVLSGAKASALIMLSRWVEAEQWARRAVKLDPRSVESNYMLGVALLMQGKITRETAECLEMAASQYPKAREHLVEVQAKLARH